MSAIAQVIDGKIVNQGTAADAANGLTTAVEASNELDKDAFLQLLVAQMRYQDPLEPTSNTEYISQLATFSELEEMQNVNASMEMSRASSLVGQYVFMKVTDSSGYTTYPEGQVDYVVYQGGKAYLSINETLYSIDDLDTVADADYLLASRLATSFSAALNKLPKPENLTRSDLDSVKEVIDVYENMTVYQRTFISNDDMTLLEKYVEQYKKMTGSEESGEDGKTE